MTQRWRVATENRVGMARDILSVVSGAGLDVEAMEVLPGLGFFRLGGTLAPGVRELLLALPGVAAVDSVPLMPQEEKQREVDAVLQTVSDGVLVVRPGGRVAGLNPAAQQILAVTEARARDAEAADVLGTDRLTRVPSSFDNEEVRAQTPRGRLHYIASGRVLGESGGLVLVLKSIQEARALAHSLTRPRTVIDIILINKDNYPPTE